MKKIGENLKFTATDFALLFLRLMLAIVIFPHGAQKLLGWFGGFGFAGTMQYFTQTRGFSWLVGFLVILIEFFGPLALFFGVAVRIWSAAVGVVMLGVILTTFRTYFFMDWFGVHKSEGFEFFLLAIGMSLTLTLAGAGKISVDSLLSIPQFRRPVQPRS